MTRKGTGSRNAFPAGRAIALAGLLALSALSGPTAAADDDAIGALLQRFDAETPGAIIGLVRDHELTEVHAAGSASLAWQRPLEASTRVNIGSTAKQFTGMALALLAAEGRLSLDDDVRDHLPELPEHDHTITLRHLASHTSGLRDYISLMMLAGVRMDRGDWIDEADILQMLDRQGELQNPPGTEWNYNNTGYVLLARVIRRVTGERFADWMRENLFEPLGMDDTRVRPTPIHIIERAATGYTRQNDTWLEMRDVAGAPGAGAVYTTVGDMARWMRHLGEFDLGGEAARVLMTTPFELADGTDTGYGLGLGIDRHGGLLRWRHGGGDLGHLSAFHYFPEIDSGYMVFANHHELSDRLIDFVGNTLLASELDVASRAPITRALGPDTFHDALFERYAGAYKIADSDDRILEFRRNSGAYVVSSPGQSPRQLRPVDARTFEIEGSDKRVRFERREDGRSRSLTLIGNEERRGRRVEADPPEGFEPGEYAGHYYSRELETYYAIEANATALRLHHRRFGPVSLYPSGDDHFSGSLPVLGVRFERGEEDGRIHGLRAGNGRARDVYFERVE